MNQKSARLFIYIVLISLFSNLPFRFLEAAPVFTITENQVTSLSGQLPYIYQSKSSTQLSAREVFRLKEEDWSAPAGRQIKIKDSQDTVWFIAKLASGSKTNQKVFVSADYPWINDVTYYHFSESGNLLQTGRGGDGVDGVPYFRTPSISLVLKPAETAVVLIRVQTDISVTADFRVYPEEDFHFTNFLHTGFQGVINGIILMLIVFHINMFLGTRNPVLPPYLLYLLSVLVFLQSRNSILPLHVFGEAVPFANTIRPLLVSFIFFTGIWFGRVFMNLGSLFPRLNRVLTVLQWFSFAPGIVMLFDRAASLEVISWIGIGLGLPMIMAGILSSLKSLSRGIYFVAGYSLPILGSIYEGLVINQIFSLSPYFTVMLPLFFCIEFLLFALVLRNDLHEMSAGKVKQTARLDRIRSELEIARRVQGDFLPKTVNDFSTGELKWRYQPGEDVSGDYFDIAYPGDHLVGLFIADMSGHRLAAALDATFVRMAFRDCSAVEKSPARVLETVNRFLCSRLKGRPVTALYAIIDLRTGVVKISNAGHYPAIIVSLSGACIAPGSQTGTMLAVHENTEYADNIVQLEKKDILLMYTEGLISAGNRQVNTAQFAEAVQSIRSRLPQSGSLCSDFLDFVVSNSDSDKDRPVKEDLTAAAFLYRGKE